MTIDLLKQMMDACYLAKRARELLPDLPEGIASSYIQYLDTIERLQQGGTSVKVSDISDALGLPRPGVTRTIKEMEAAGLLSKTGSPEDGRITVLSVTPKGRELSQTYNTQVFSLLKPYMEEISEADALCMIRTMTAFHRIMTERRNLLSDECSKEFRK